MTTTLASNRNERDRSMRLQILAQQ
jgi:hypothetical protein